MAPRAAHEPPDPSDPSRPPAPFDRRVLLVSGKGGTGKSTVAAALALAGARTGRRTLLVETEGRGGMARLLRVPALRFEEEPTPLGFHAMALTAHEALIEYLTRIMGLRGLGGPLRRARVTEMATEAIPGFRDMMIGGKLHELTGWREVHPDAGRRPYDLLVVDGPPTGQLIQLLRAPEAYRDLIRVGRAARQVVSIHRLFTDELRVVLVAIPEEMSVAETLEAVEGLDGMGAVYGPVLVNRVIPPVFPTGVGAAARRLSPADVAGVLGRAGHPVPEPVAAALLESALMEDGRRRAQRGRVARLARAGPIVELPLLATPSMGPGELEVLADTISAGRGEPAGEGSA
ncbi:MAG: ATPase [Actinobacteria bacterium]|nr:ATPase [Actinomycetota bacterium]